MSFRGEPASERGLSTSPEMAKTRTKVRRLVLKPLPPSPDRPDGIGSATGVVPDEESELTAIFTLRLRRIFPLLIDKREHRPSRGHWQIARNNPAPLVRRVLGLDPCSGGADNRAARQDGMSQNSPPRTSPMKEKIR